MTNHILNHIDQIRTETRQLEQQLQEKDAEIQAKYRQVQELNKTLREKEATIAGKEATILNKEARIVELSSGYTTLADELGRKDRTLTAREADIRRVSAQLEEAKTEIQRKDEHYGRVVAENFNLRQAQDALPLVADLRAEVSSKASEILNANVALDLLRRQLAAAQADVASSAVKLASAKGEIQRNGEYCGRIVADNFNLLQTRYDQVAAAPHVVALQATPTKEALVSVQDKTIDQLRAQVTEANQRIHDLEALATERGDRIDALNQLITVRGDRIDALTQLITAGDGGMSPMRLGTAIHTMVESGMREIRNRDATIATLDGKVVQLGKMLDDERQAAAHKLEVCDRARRQAEQDLAALRTARDAQVATLCAEIAQLRGSGAPPDWTYNPAMRGWAFNPNMKSWVPPQDAAPRVGLGLDPRLDALRGVPLRGAARTYGRPEEVTAGPRGCVHTMEASLTLKDATIRRHEATIAMLVTERDALAARITQLDDARSANAKAATWSQATLSKRVVDELGQQVEQLTKTYQRLQRVTTPDTKEPE